MALCVFVNQCCTINITGYNIFITVIIQICIYATIRKCKRIFFNAIFFISKRKIAVVFVKFIWQFYFRKFIYQCQIFIINIIFMYFLLHLAVRNKIDVINIIHPFWNTVRYKKIFQSVIIKISKQCRPRPVSCRYASI